MELSVRDRLVLLSIIPAQGDYLTLKIVRKLRESLSFSEEEHAAFKFVNGEDNMVTWDDSTPQIKEIELTTKAQTIVSEALAELNRTKKLKDEHFDLYEKFVKEDA